MKKKGILNPQINRVISEMGHRDMLIIADAGLPIPREVERIDLILKCGIPSFKEVLSAVLPEMEIEEAYLANEITEKNSQMFDFISSQVKNLHFIAHEDFKELSRKARAIIRTGECSSYANIILISGVTF